MNSIRISGVAFGLNVFVIWNPFFFFLRKASCWIEGFLFGGSNSSGGVDSFATFIHEFPITHVHVKRDLRPRQIDNWDTCVVPWRWNLRVEARSCVCVCMNRCDYVCAGVGVCRSSSVTLNYFLGPALRKIMSYHQFPTTSTNQPYAMRASCIQNTDMQTDRQTDRQIDRQTDRQTHTHTAPTPLLG